MPYIVTAQLTDGSRGYLNRGGGFSRDRALARVYKQRHAADTNAEKWGGQVEEIATKGKNSIEQERDQLRAACEAAIDYIIAVHAHKLWNEHPSYDRERARRVAEADPPDVVLQIRAALREANDAE